MVVPEGATRARVEAAFEMPADGVTFRPTTVEVEVRDHDPRPPLRTGAD